MDGDMNGPLGPTQSGSLLPNPCRMAENIPMLGEGGWPDGVGRGRRSLRHSRGKIWRKSAWAHAKTGDITDKDIQKQEAKMDATMEMKKFEAELEQTRAVTTKLQAETMKIQT